MDKVDNIWYNKMYAPTNPTVGTVVESRAGHDEKRVYLVAAVVGEDFVLCVDGEYRKLSNPKQKRCKHLKPIGAVSEETMEKLKSGKLTDAAIRKVLKAAKTK